MVLKMASEGMRAPSPPLPPDPSPRTVTPAQPYQQSPRPGSQQTSPTTPSKDQYQSGLKRVDSSRTPQPKPRQPIQDAVTDAFEHSPVTNQLNNLNQLDPDFIRQVTEQVIRNLQAAGATPTASVQPQQAPFAPPPSQPAQEPRSPNRSSVDSGAASFTPPSPERNRETRESGTTSPSPSDTGSNFSRESRESVKSSESQRSSNTPKPFNSESNSRVPKSNYSARRRSEAVPPQDERESRGSGGYDNTRRDKTPFRRNSKESGYDGASRSQVRQPAVEPDTGETPLEKFWQPLFDNGNPTMRLSQFLRGLALHLIDDYEPRGSLVVTPAKMLQFLNETRVEQEHYPWEIIFGGKLTPVSISYMFQKLLCQHHLIQERYDRAPTIPGLSPNGFDWFMTCLIQAHPDTEFERLQKAVQNMPISNADNKTERFPKELSRRLLPAKANIQAEQRLVSSLNHEPHVFATLRGTSQMPPPPSNPPPPQSNIERERQRYSQSSQPSNAVDDEDLAAPPPVQIERERKPYTAKEGSGKQYEDGRPNPVPYRSDSSQANGNRTSRTNSGVPPQAHGYPSSSGPSEPVNIPPRQAHRLSTSQIPPPMANGSNSRPARRSPPTLSNPFAKSDPNFVGSMPNSQYGSNLYPTQSREQYTPVDPDEEQLKRYRSRSRADRPGTVGSDEDMNNGRAYAIPSRSVPVANGYEYGAGTIGGPPIGSDPRSQPGGTMHPVGSFPARRPTMGGGNDERRRSMYGSANIGIGGDGGTDGYGSYSNSMNGGSGYPPPPSQQQPYGTSAQH